jgi:hypothetical protein
MFIRMTAEGMPDSDRVEFRVFVDKDRAEIFCAELGELAASYSGTVVAPPEKPKLAAAPSPETTVPTRPFRVDMTTAIHQEKTGEQVTIVTKEDFRRFGLRHGYDGTLISRAYSRMMKFGTESSATPNGQPKVPYVAKGSLVEPLTPDEPERPVQTVGFRIENLEHLARELIYSRNKMLNFGTRSQELLNHFVEELFPFDQDAN